MKEVSNKNLRAVYYCATAHKKWGKSLNPETAKKIAGCKKGVPFILMAAIYDNPSDKELKNLLLCVTADPIDGGPIYYDLNRTEEDTEMIETYHVGWLMIEDKR